jgi:hypothetical protein
VRRFRGVAAALLAALALPGCIVALDEGGRRGLERRIDRIEKRIERLETERGIAPPKGEAKK